MTDHPPASAPGTSDDQPAESEAITLESVAQRISGMLSALAAIGLDPGGGVTRPGYSATERDAHRLAATWLAELDLLVREDAAGNTIADEVGAAGSCPRLVLGSHLDSVAGGGRYDGAVGVVAAIEVIRGLRARGVALSHPLRVVCFAAEEGARFGETCIGSKAIAGLLPATAEGLTDEQGSTLGQAMRSLGFDPARMGESRWGGGEAAVFLELHIEQGRTLEDQAVSIGIAEAVAGSARILLTVRGQADHSGAPMRVRRDALAGAAEITLAVEAAGLDPANHGMRATVGRLRLEPNDLTTIPGEVRLGIDIDDVDTERLHAVATSLVTAAREVCARRALELEEQVIATLPPVVLPTWLREIAAQACRDVPLDYRVMTSRAGRDAQVMNTVAPAGLISVPSRRGLSHVPEEWTSSLDIARGVHLLVEWIMRLDLHLARWERVSD